MREKTYLHTNLRACLESAKVVQTLRCVVGIRGGRRGGEVGPFAEALAQALIGRVDARVSALLVR